VGTYNGGQDDVSDKLCYNQSCYRFVVVVLFFLRSFVLQVS
jgi:hypothetical protein